MAMRCPHTYHYLKLAALLYLIRNRNVQVYNAPVRLSRSLRCGGPEISQGPRRGDTPGMYSFFIYYQAVGH